MSSDADPHVWRTVFNAFDRDGSGRIDRDELTRALRRLGGDWTKQRIARALDEFDADGQGALTFEQFYVMVTGGAPLVDPELVRAFRAMDIDGDGQITAEELEGLFNAAGVNAKAEIAAFVDEADHDRNGVITFDEFMSIAQKTGRNDG